MSVQSPSPSLTLDQQDILWLLAWAWLQHRQPERALPLYRLLHRLLPDNDRILHGLSMTLLQVGEADAALPMLDNAIRSERGSAMTWLLRGRALSALGRMPEAARAMRMYAGLRRRDGVHRNTAGEGA